MSVLNRLTPLAWGMLALTFLAVVGSVGYGLYAVGVFSGGSSEPVAANGTAPAPAPNGGGLLGGLMGSSKPSGPLGSPGNPIKFSGVSFHGYAPLIVANGGMTTQPGSLMAQQGVNVEFLIQDDIPTLATVFESGTAHCVWRTSDFWAQEHPGLRGSGHDGKAIMVVDNTRGADAVIATDPSIQSIEDLAGKKVALLQFTPSHGMLIDAIENSSLSGRRKSSIETVFINGDTSGVRAALESGQVDAAVLWDPDLSLAMRIPGAHVVYSTAIATNLIYDVVVCDSRYLDDPANEGAFQNFVAGWMAGVDAAESDLNGTTQILAKNETFFGDILRNEGPQFFTQELYAKIDWTNTADNVRILGLTSTGATNHYERVYGRFDKVYRKIGATGDPNAPVINPAESFDYRFIKALALASPAAVSKAQEPQFTFTSTNRAEAVSRPSVVAKPVTVNFQVGSADLTKRSESTIDDEMVPQIENFGSSYFVVSGNTDTTGSASTNRSLSRRRAQAVVDYLVREWEFPAERFEVVGNGEDALLCDEGNPNSSGYDSLEECRAANRAVRLEVKGR